MKEKPSRILNFRSHNRKFGTGTEPGRSIANPKRVAFSVIAPLLVVCGVVAQAQQTKAHRIGVLLSGSSSSNASRIAAFQQGLRELGYTEHQNVVDYRFAEGDVDRFPLLAAELVRLKPDVLVTSVRPEYKHS